MNPYKNLSGKSGVIAYEIGKMFIRIRFAAESSIYTYNYERPGKAIVEHMKMLAVKGKGLSTFISREVRENYASKK